MDDGRPFRLLVLLEGTTVTGPAKLVLDFCRAAQGMRGSPPIIAFLTSFLRGPAGQSTETPSNQLLSAATAAGMKVSPIQERFRFDLRVVPALRETVRRLKPDIIESHHVKSHFLVRLSGVWRDRPWVAFHHGYTNDARRTLLYNQLDRWSLPAAARVVAVCGPFRQQLISRGVPASHITVVHSAIETAWFSGSGPFERPATTQPDKAEKRVFAVGRLSREKAFDDLITALKELRRRSPQLFVRLLLAGEGPERTRIQQLVQELGLQDRVTLLGHVQDLRPYYQTADVVAISSLSEGSPLVLMEAMAAGVPVVATAVGGIPEVVRDRESALLVPPRQPEQMAAALQSLLSDSELARSLTARAQESIRLHHSPEARAHRILALYRSLRG